MNRFEHPVAYALVPFKQGANRDIVIQEIAAIEPHGPKQDVELLFGYKKPFDSVSLLMEYAQVESWKIPVIVRTTVEILTGRMGINVTA